MKNVIMEHTSTKSEEIEHLRLLRILISITEYNDISDLFDELDPSFFGDVIEEVILIE